MALASSVPRVLAITWLAAAILGCAGPNVPNPSPTALAFLARVQAGDEVIGVVRVGSSLELFVVDRSGQSEMITRSNESDTKPTVHLSAFGGHTGLVYNTFVFGTAPDDAARFALTSPTSGLGGDVFGGTFVVALQQRDVAPTDLTWTFLRQDGSVITDGSGIRD